MPTSTRPIRVPIRASDLGSPNLGKSYPATRGQILRGSLLDLPIPSTTWVWLLVWVAETKTRGSARCFAHRAWTAVPRSSPENEAHLAGAQVRRFDLSDVRRVTQAKVPWERQKGIGASPMNRSPSPQSLHNTYEDQGQPQWPDYDCCEPDGQANGQEKPSASEPRPSLHTATIAPVRWWVNLAEDGTLIHPTVSE